VQYPAAHVSPNAGLVLHAVLCCAYVYVYVGCHTCHTQATPSPVTVSGRVQRQTRAPARLRDCDLAREDDDGALDPAEQPATKKRRGSK
jgi:hypothetical protein